MTFRIIAGAALASATLNAASAETVWIGNAFIDAVSGDATCTSTFGVGDFGRLIFRPRGGRLANGGDSQLVYVGTRSAFQMNVHNGDFKTSATFVSQSVGSTAKIGSGNGQVVSWTQTPAAPTAAGDDTIAVTAQFTKFYRINNCVVTLRTNLVQR